MSFIDVHVLLLDQPLSAPRSCADVQCRYGASCVVSADAAVGPRCVCHSACEAGVTGGDGAACGTDGQTYGSECQLRLFACRMQKHIDLLHEGPCNGQSLYSLRVSHCHGHYHRITNLGRSVAPCPRLMALRHGSAREAPESGLRLRLFVAKKQKRRALNLLHECLV